MKCGRRLEVTRHHGQRSQGFVVREEQVQDVPCILGGPCRLLYYLLQVCFLSDSEQFPACDGVVCIWLHCLSFPVYVGQVEISSQPNVCIARNPSKACLQIIEVRRVVNSGAPIESSNIQVFVACDLHLHPQVFVWRVDLQFFRLTTLILRRNKYEHSPVAGWVVTHR